MDKNECCLPKNWKEPKVILAFLAVILLALIIIFSILRDKFVNNIQNQITVTGRGEVMYQPDVALINLGVKIDRAENAQTALSQMNEKINNVVNALKELGITEENITTQNYSLFPQYDYKDGSSQISGYGANQQIVVRVENVDEDGSLMKDAVIKASEAGINQVLGINFEVSNVNDFKQKARIAAIEDARSKANELIEAAGIKKLGSVVTWYENILSDSGDQSFKYAQGLGSGGESSVSPNITTGDEKIVIEMSVIYEVK